MDLSTPKTHTACSCEAPVPSHVVVPRYRYTMGFATHGLQRAQRGRNDHRGVLCSLVTITTSQPLSIRGTAAFGPKALNDMADRTIGLAVRMSTPVC